MSGPPDYMAQIAATLGGGPSPSGPVMLGQPQGGAPSYISQVGQGLGPTLPGAAPLLPPPPPPNMSPMPPPAPPPMSLASTPAPPLPPPRPQSAPGPAPFLRQVGGGGAVNVPAHETELRGPHLQAAQEARNSALGHAIEDVRARSQAQADNDLVTAKLQEQAAADREKAAQVAAAERAQEMAAHAADFQASVKALSQTSVDPGRFWSNMSVGGKIAALASITLGGFTSQQNGGHNLGLEQFNTLVNNDIKAQETAYAINKDVVNAKQTAFSMAMQKYNNVDAARAMARAAALDTAQAQLAQQAALWKGTDAANRGTMAIAALEDEKAQQIAQGIAFAPARTVNVAPQFVDPRTGLRYSEQEAKGLVKTMDEHDFEERKQGTGIAGQLLVEGAKVDKSAAKDQRALSVKLPNGDVVQGRDAVQARELSEAATASHEIARLTAQAKEIRSGEGFRIPGSASRARLEQIQKNLITNYAVMHKLGAISGPDMDLATGGTAKLFDVGPGPEAALDSLNDTAQANIRNIVKTIPDAPGTAKGEMPASFTPHGAK